MEGDGRGKVKGDGGWRVTVSGGRRESEGEG